MSKVQSTLAYPLTNGSRVATLATNNSVNSFKQLNDTNVVTVDICRTKWFFVLITATTMIAMFNLGINLWLIKVLQLRNNNIAIESLYSNEEGINFNANVRFVGSVNTELIESSPSDEQLTLFTDDTLTLTNSNEFGAVNFTIGHNKLEVKAPSFRVYSTKNKQKKLQFSINSNEVITDSVKEWNAENGLSVSSSLATNNVQGDFARDLRLESSTESMRINASDDINIESKANEIKISSFGEIELMASNQLVIDSSRIEVKNLQNAAFESTGEASKEIPVFQVCSCENGRIFLAAAFSACKAHIDTCHSF